MNTNIAVVLLLASFACAENVQQQIPGNTAYGYLTNIGVPLAEKIRDAEEKGTSQSQRIIGGSFAEPGQFKYQAGILSSIIDVDGRGVCGGALITANRVLTAAHCWWDGVHQVWLLEIVLGSTFIFSGGLRLHTRAIGIHPGFNPSLVRNDIAVAYLPTSVTFTDLIGPIPLPTGGQLEENYVGEYAIASGYGLAAEGTMTGNLRFVGLSIISNNVCRFAFPFILQSTNVCTSGADGGGTCQGDSGGPLVVFRHDRPILIGITSFGNGLFSSCESSMPAGYTRVSSYNDFIRSHFE